MTVEQYFGDFKLLLINWLLIKNKCIQVKIPVHFGSDKLVYSKINLTNNVSLNSLSEIRGTKTGKCKWVIKLVI